MESEANQDLFDRQRTFSIDETREQLQQGRPVQRDAIAPGSTTADYASLMYGDGIATEDRISSYRGRGAVDGASVFSSEICDPSSPPKKPPGTWAGVVMSNVAKETAIAAITNKKPQPASNNNTTTPIGSPNSKKQETRGAKQGSQSNTPARSSAQQKEKESREKEKEGSVERKHGSSEHEGKGASKPNRKDSHVS